MAATHNEQQTPVIYYQDLHKTSCIQMAGCFTKAYRPDPLSNISGMKRLAKRATPLSDRQATECFSNAPYYRLLHFVLPEHNPAWHDFIDIVVATLIHVASETASECGKPEFASGKPDKVRHINHRY